ncbi:MAG: N-6 DNA methylase [Prosthecobacter sp.]|uniref:N-6 DNA methylase n=1 Tax=Prosthecobacter sp. TaxID=1965333 RepID=UPI001A0BF990|nr:N-6 DNA methylase [Prosthecobacter sp.]MBE2282116.1 N-6 DNA methylase [Prosthecobacter sp.]
MLTSETKRRIDSCRDILVGKLPLPTDQVELITLALIYKFMDDLDEESVEMGGRRSFFTQHLEPYRWRNLLPQTVSAEQRMALFARGIELLGGADMEIEVKEKGEVKKKRIIPAAHLPGLFRDVFRNAFLKFRDGRILTMFLTEVNAFAYSHSEELGNAFEYLLQCMGTQGENGQFRTPRHIIDFVVACLDPQPGDRILDPACGTGGFLVSAYKHILSRHTSAGSSIPGDQLTHEQRQQVYANLTGYDITDLMVKLSKVNLFLHGFPDPAIHIYDTLSNDARWEEKADLILANPPFMTPKGGVTPHTKFRIAAKKAEVLFTDYIAEHLSSRGRGGVIVPNGIVATTQNAYVKLRRFLVEDCLVAVVSLPSGVFKPYSGVKTSILFFDKQLARKTKEVLFLKITADGFDLGDQRREIEANDLPEAERVVKAWLGGPMAGAEGAGFRAKGPSSSQPGPTAQEPGTKTRQGLKARAMPAAVTLVHESGLQPSAVIADAPPGALPQAGMGSAVGAAVVWKRVEKSTLLESRACSLQAETFFGEKAPDSTVEMVVLGDVATLGNGGTPSKANAAFWKGDIPWVSPKDMKSLVITDTEDHVSASAVESSATKLLPAGTVLCVVRSGILKHTLPLAITARPMCTNQDILAITPDQERLDPKFLLFVLKGRSAEILRDGIKSGVTVESSHNGFFKTFEIPLPPLEEQRRVVAEIEGYQKVLDGARQILAGYAPHIAPDAEWVRTTIGEVCDNFMNGLNFTKEQMGHGVKFVNIKDVFSEGFIQCENLGLVDVSPREVEKRLVELSRCAEGA